MDVMNFRGSSLASAASIRQVVSNVRSQADRRPIVIAFGMGDTTGFLPQVHH